MKDFETIKQEYLAAKDIYEEELKNKEKEELEEILDVNISR